MKKKKDDLKFCPFCQLSYNGDKCPYCDEEEDKSMWSAADKKGKLGDKNGRS